MHRIVVAYGDGIGPEITDATLKILQEAGAKLQIETISVGEDLYKKGYSSGMAPDAWDAIHNSVAMLKGPITTPQGEGYKSLNVTMRKALGLFANIRPVKTFNPIVTSKSDMDLVIIRENEEDLYTGIEHRQTFNTFQGLKLISAQGCFNIIKYAFDYAQRNGRKKVTALVKDNIMKMTDGLFHNIFKEVAKFYPEIIAEAYIVDIGMARVAARPENFDVVVTLNLYGDIVSDIAAEVSGSVGMAGSANIGKDYAMFEAIHGSAPNMAGKHTANPSGILNASVMMLRHLGDHETAGIVENAWLRTLEEGIHTKDIYKPDISKKNATTEEFRDAIIKRLGKKPQYLKEASEVRPQSSSHDLQLAQVFTKPSKKELVGVDVFVDQEVKSVKDLAEHINNLVASCKLNLQVISSMGLKVWPVSDMKLKNTEHLCLRFVSKLADKVVEHGDIIDLLAVMQKAKIDFIKTENLYTFDGKIGFTLAQGE